MHTAVLSSGRRCSGDPQRSSAAEEEHPAGGVYVAYVRGGEGADYGDIGVAGMPESHDTPLGTGTDASLRSGVPFTRI